jgi:hypothetical protein
VSCRDIFCPMFMSSRFKNVYNKIDVYIKKKLSHESLLKSSEEFERLKAYLYNEQELYVFNNIHRFSNIMLEKKEEEVFDLKRFKGCYNNISQNTKLKKIIDE